MKNKFYEELTEAQQDYIDDIATNYGYSKELLADVYLTGYADSYRTTMLGLSQKFDDLADIDIK